MRTGLIVLLFIFLVTGARAQTPGLIIKPATGGGAAVLDPNGDGYASVYSTGYVANDYEHTETELPVVTVVRPDPSGDPVKGPSGSFNDIVGTSADGENAIFTYIDGSDNLIFRFRLDGYAPNSKTYSMLIDTDGKFGFTGVDADPNAVTGNPGFEIEVSLQTNFGVFVYNIDGTATQPSASVSYTGDTNYQQSIAYTTNSSDPDYFYDFFVPLSALGITASTPLRYAALTTMNPNGGIGSNSQSDVGGTSEGTNLDNVFEDLINDQTPTPPGEEVLVRSECPTINTPILTNSTVVSGTSTEADGSTVRIYINGSSTPAGTGTVSGGTWTVSVSALAGGTLVSATVQATGEGESSSSCNDEIVGADCLINPIFTVITGGDKGITVTNVNDFTVGTVFTIYNADGSVWVGNKADNNPYTMTATDQTNGSFNIGCGGQGNCMSNGRYYVTANASGSCESPGAWFCVGIATTSPIPTITDNVTTSSTTISGTGTNGSTIYLYTVLAGDTTFQQTTMVDGTGNWSLTPLFTIEDCMELYASQLNTTACMSLPSASVYADGGTLSSPPVIFGADCILGATLADVSGFSTEAQGAIIEVFDNADDSSFGTTTVNATGNWTLTGANIAAGTTIYATATDDINCRSTSLASATVTITSKASNAGLSISTSPIIENVTSTITGTGTIGYTVTLLLDDYDVLGTGLVDGSGNFSIAISSTDLYAGGIVTATQTTSGYCESDPSAGVTVDCEAPDNSYSLSAVDPGVCEQEFGQFTINPSESGVIYTPVLASDESIAGYSTLGTGGAITLTTYGLTVDPTVFKVKALKIGAVSCENISTNSISIDMYLNPVDKTITPASSAICAGQSVTITIASYDIDVTYSLQNAGNGASIAFASNVNGSNLELTTDPLYADITIQVYAEKDYSGTPCSSVMNQTTAITVTNPGTSQNVSADLALLCTSGTTNINVATNNDGHTYQVYRSSDNATVGASFTGNGTTQSVSTGTLNATETFYVTINDGGACGEIQLEQTVTVQVSTLALSEVNISNASCYGDTDGQLSVTVTGNNVGAIAYSWSNGATTASITDLSSGNYTVTVTDGGNCPIQQTYTVGQPNELVVITTTIQNDNGSTNGIIEASYTGGTENFSIDWTRTSPASPAVNGSVTGLLSTDSPYSITGLEEGTYEITITDANGCSDTGSAIVGSAASLIVNSTVTNVSCLNGSDGAIDLQVGGGSGSYTYDWDNDGLEDPDNDPQDLTGLTAGDYTVIITDTGNSTTETVSITVSEPETAVSVSGTATNVLCFGDMNGSISITPSGGTPGYTYNWTGPNSYNSTSQNISALTPGNYNVIISDSKGCTVSATFTVVEPDPISISLTVTSASSFGASDGAINATVSGGTGSYTYNWSHIEGSDDPEDVSNLTAGSYQLTVTDGNGCSSSAVGNIGQPVDAEQNCTYVIADDFESGNYSGNGGTTSGLSWDANWAESPETTNPNAGYARIVAAGAGNCASSASLNLGSIDGSNINIPTTSIERTTNLSYFNSAAVYFDYCISAADEGQLNIYFNDFLQSTISFTGGGSQVDFNLPVPPTMLATNFIIKFVVSSPSGGSNKTKAYIAIDNLEIRTGAAFKATATPSDLSCYQNASGSIDLEIDNDSIGVSTAYSYLWNTGAVTQDISGLAAGSYNVAVTDGAGCTLNLNSIVVNEPAPISATILATDPICPGGTNGAISINSASGGDGGPYEYLILDSNDNVELAWGSTNNVSGLPEDTYKAYVRNTDNTCETTISTSITLTGVDDVDPTIACPANYSVAANGGSCKAGLTVSGPTILTDDCDPTPTYSWEMVEPTLGTSTGTGAIGNYQYEVGITTITYTASDATGNTNTCSFTVTVTSDIDIAGFGIAANNLCVGDNGLVNTSGNLADGDYTVTYSLLGANTASSSTATLTVAGGTGGGSFTVPSTELTSTGTTTIGIESLESATSSCSSPIVGVSDNFEVHPIPTAPTGDAAQYFCSADNATVSDLVVTGSVIKWYDSASGGNMISGAMALSDGIIYYASQTVNSCESTDRLAVTATVYTTPTITGTTDGERCGTGTVNLAATTSAGTINWYSAPTGGSSLGTGTTFTSPSISATTSYWVDATENGCTTPARTELVATVNPLPSAPISGGDVSTCSGSSNPPLTVSVNAGETADWYTVSSGGTAIATGTLSYTSGETAAGTYTYYIEARNSTTGCISASRTAITITINSTPSAPTSNGNESVCAGNPNPALNVNVASGVTADWYSTASGGTALPAGTGTLSYTSGESAAGTYTYYAEARNTTSGCLSSSRTAVSLTINPLPTPVLTSSDADNTICSGESVTFTASGGSTYEFKINGITVQSNSASTTYTTSTLSDGDVVTVVVTSSQGCTATSAGLTFTVNICDTPPVANNDSYSLTCTSEATGLDLLANDTDDSALDLTSVVLDPAGAAVTAGNTYTDVDGNEWTVTTAGLLTVVPASACSSISTTYTVKDDTGQSSNTATITVTFSDAIVPTFTTCPGTQTVNANTVGCMYTVSGTGLDPVATDNCTISSLTHNYDGGGSTLDGKFFPEGTTTVVWTATDACGNTSTCTYDVTVRSITVTVQLVSLDNECPELQANQGFNPENTSYDAGATEVIFRVTLNNSDATTWNLDYNIGATVVVRSGLDDPSPNPQSSNNYSVNNGTNTIDLIFYINNVPGSDITPVFTVTSVTDAWGCNYATDESASVIIKTMPEVGAFN